MEQNLQNNQNFKREVGKQPVIPNLIRNGLLSCGNPVGYAALTKKLFCGFCEFCDKNSTMKNTIVLVCLLLLMFSVFAQHPDSRSLSVQDCIDMALENNNELKNSQLEIEKARATKNEASAEYYPTVSAQAVAFDALNPMITFGIEDIDNAQLRQLLYTLYAEYGANMGLDKEYSFVQNGVMLNAMATEPIYAGGRIRNGNKLAKLGVEAAETQAKVKEDEVCLQTETLYWQIVASGPACRCGSYDCSPCCRRKDNDALHRLH